MPVSIEVNTRLKRSWRIVRQKRTFLLVIPTLLSHAPIEVKEALILWATILIGNNFSKRTLPKEQKEVFRNSEKLIWNFLTDEGEVSNYRTFHTPAQKFRDSSGIKFDLQTLFETLNDKWFDGELKSWLRWGRYGSKTSYHTLIQDEQKEIHHLITIAGLYNHPSVPQFAVEAVLYHEMLHIAEPPKEGKLRRNVHHKEFRKREKAFPHYQKWQEWLQGHRSFFMAKE